MARHGYVSLFNGAASSAGDTAAMLDARSAFLAGGHYSRIARHLAEQVVNGQVVNGPIPGEVNQPLIVDLGAGTGYYLDYVLNALPHAYGIGLDISRYAARRLARVNPRLGAVAADAWQRLPLIADSVDHLFAVFAPRNPEHIRDVLRIGGRLTVVTPSERHLSQVAQELGMLTMPSGKADQLVTTFGKYLQPVTANLVEYDVRLDEASLTQVAAMGPAAFHTDPATFAQRARKLGPTVATVSVDVLTFERPLFANGCE